MIIDYNYIKQAAKERGCRVEDLIALASGNDPFYCAPGRVVNGQWFAQQLENLGVEGEFHERKLHYRLVTQETPIKRPDGSDYENTEKCWDGLTVAGLAARYTRDVDSDRYVDRRNPEPEIYHRVSNEPEPETLIAEGGSWFQYGLPSVPELENLPDSLPDLPAYFATDLPAVTEQPILVEIFCEKTTMNDILIPVCEEYGVNLVCGMGELSEIACRLFVQRCARLGKPGRILYISDFDPAGVGMPVAVARKIEWYQRTFEEFTDLDIRLEPIALTREQIDKYDLPRIPCKDSDRRKDRFEMAHGEGQVELDALEALYSGTLARIVEAAILQYHDPDLRGETVKAYREFEGYLDRMNDITHSTYQDRLAGIEAEYQALYSAWQAIRARFRQFVEPFNAEIEKLTGRADDLRERAQALHGDVLDHLEIHLGDLDKYEPPEADLPDEPDGQLYDSRRDYFEQLPVYKRHRAGEAKGAAV